MFVEIPNYTVDHSESNILTGDTFPLEIRMRGVWRKKMKDMDLEHSSCAGTLFGMCNTARQELEDLGAAVLDSHCIPTDYVVMHDIYIYIYI